MAYRELRSLPVEIDIADPVLASAVEGILLEEFGHQRKTFSMLITDEPLHTGKMTLLIIGTGDLAARRAVDLVSTGRLGSACPTDLIHTLPWLIQCVESDFIALPSQLLVRAHRAPVLSRAHYDLLTELRKGRSNRELMAHFNWSLATVKRRLTELMDIFDVDNRTALAAVADF